MGAGKNPGIVPLHRTRHRVNYFKGKDPSGWYKNIPSFTAVLFKNLYKHIDLNVYGKQNRVEYDWIVKTGGKPGDIKLKYSSAKQTFIDGDGNLVIETAEGRFLHRKPVSFQVINGERRAIASSFTTIESGTYGFEVKNYDRNYELIIDPYVVYYSTYLGGSGGDDGSGIAVDSSGCAYIGGYTNSTDFPTLNPFQQSFGGGERDAFFARLSPTGDALLYSSYLGGNGVDEGQGIAVDNNGKVYLTGSTSSSNFPLRYPLQDTLAAGPDAFVTKLIFTDITAYQLKVRSTGITSVPITVTPSDYLGETNGSTDFTRTYAAGTVVTLTAPQNHNQATFLKWVKGSSEYTSARIQLTMSSDRMVEAVYKTPAKISLDRTHLTFGVIINGVTTGPQQFTIDNTGDEDMNWTISVDPLGDLYFTPTYGTNAGVVTVSVDPTGFAPIDVDPYSFFSRIAIHAGNASNSPQIVTVTFNVYKPGSTSVPFGTFETPTSGSTIRSGVPFTGWVLDDIGVERVKIYNGNTYIGDAVFVEGARPDVEQAYPRYPMNYRAGWGYMMLTNFLPNGGNGTYTFHAIAVDKEGHQKRLGSKTVTIDNAHAVKPFGAIDTPTQGGPASGDHFINWGWVLTPQPNSIPVDGSTISVWVDGVSIGHPTYNNYRADIASLFPGYANSNGAVGYFYLDTTAYKNGVHTIQWAAADSAGNIDGIGSRYFTIQNSISAPRGQGGLPPCWDALVSWS